MRRFVVISLFALALVFASVLGLTSLSSDGIAAPPNDDVVILFCGASFHSTPAAIIVVAASSSANAPAITQDTSCTQALADLLNGGFEIKDVQPVFSDGALYTLVR